MPTNFHDRLVTRHRTFREQAIELREGADPEGLVAREPP
jgi:hypothetical protein